MLLEDIIDKLNDSFSDDESVASQKQTTQPYNQSNMDAIPQLDPYQTLRIEGVKKQVSQWLKPWRNKQLYAITEVTGCILQTYIKLSGILKPEDLDTSKFFYLLDVYGRIGDAVHNYVYNYYKFKEVELMLEDPVNHVRGKIDGLTYDNVIWELKSGKVSGSEKKQVALQHHLLRLHNIEVKEYKVWWILQQKIETYKPEELDPIAEELLHKTNMLYQSLQTLTPPIDLVDETQCKYCPVHIVCKRLRNKQNL